MRILPHHQDTGGFFVAVLEKLKALPWESETIVTSEIAELPANPSEEKEVESEKVTDKKRMLEDDKKPWGPQRKRKRLQGYREDPFVFFKNENEDVWPSIKYVNLLR